jgi:hypothetical protein
MGSRAGEPGILMSVVTRLRRLTAWGVGVSLVLVGMLTACGGGQPPALGTLAPATGPPVPGLMSCSHSLHFSPMGDGYPLLCDRLGINLVAWSYYAATDPPVLGLGRGASVSEVKLAMCDGLTQGHAPATVETCAERMAGVYYGWHFSLNPDTGFPDYCSGA